MRINLTLDSIDGDTLWDAQCAWQRTAAIPMPSALQEHPYVQIAGSAFTWITPPMSPARHFAWLQEFAQLRTEREMPLVTPGIVIKRETPPAGQQHMTIVED